ncbi:MAG: hypothetical protein HY901_32875 [Deltaproteobacteria bacterium]|nr:hypothetical protein [Deltaproteobacteria bacterium]
MSEHIGIVCGMEESFPAAFIERVNQTPGFKAEFAKLGGITETHQPPYKVLIDRISHEVPYYRIFLKTASLAGTYVINDPLWWSCDDKFFGYTLAAKLGVKVPRTVLLPQHSYIPAINPQKSLRNLEYPLDWESIVDYIKFPAILKPAEGGGWKNVSLVHNLNELWHAYNQSGQLAMTLQQFIDFDEYVRCLCIGREFILPIKYDPKQRRYIEADNFLPKDLEKKILDGAWALNNALGYDMNSVEFAVQDGVPYAIDFTNPAPDFDVNSILPRYFHVAVDEMAKLAIAAAREGRTNHKGYAFRQWMAKPTPRPTAGPAKKAG